MGCPVNRHDSGNRYLSTIRLKGIQVRKLISLLSICSLMKRTENMEKFLSFRHYVPLFPFTIGTGNIVGVATAIVVAAMGALFWMIVAATVGTATKYSNIFSPSNTERSARWTYCRRWFYWHRKRYGENWKWLAKNLCYFQNCYGRSFRYWYLL